MLKTIGSLIRMAYIAYAVHCLPLSMFYPFGIGSGDSKLVSGDDLVSEKIQLNYSMSCFGTSYSSLYVSIIGGTFHYRVGSM